ncbi:hypothetical protein [Falsibacillus albus]|uniref:DUF5673 domain-containing protein n=1 Tax=Falsibacillus albus TaxID=2478915 RepID=A0A3L7K0X7_9BACI|nr:hypothetical protein [Falsibacillus albus]RLQ94302.1 hypothetical protein D9X91_14695 [Falsibacillus albus]
MKIERINGEYDYMIIAVIIICIISSFILPFIFVYLIQESIFNSASNWIFFSPLSAYFTFMLGMLWIPVPLAVHLIIKNKTSRSSSLLTGILIIFISGPLFFSSINNYVFIDQQGIHYNDLFKKSPTEFSWDKIQNVHEVFQKKNGNNILIEYDFVTDSNKVIKLPSTKVSVLNKSLIYQQLEKHGVEVDNNLKDLYE